ncbi:Lrp/AsnC family transcriptional regulator, partial [Streptomyces fulvissimus]|nr:Lrp/AsnC family transcriptional regulator [Streptomyces microflavus]
WDTGLLPAEAVADLRPATLAPPCDRDDWDRAPQALSALEQAVADALAQDGRLPVSALARRLDRSESSVSR